MPFGGLAADGSVPFTIHPSDIAIPPIQSGSGTLEYSISTPASGTMVPTASGRKIEFNTTVTANLMQADGRGGTMVYPMPFSTESEFATNLSHTHTVEVTGMRLIEGVWYVQLVGATVNKENAYPKPGAAVYTVLSGQFDQIP
jgi:hypothetical protein